MGEPEAKRARTAAVAEPAELKCSITLELLRDPVSNCVGNTYERAAIEAHLAKPGAKRDPLTNEALSSIKLVPNQLARRLVQNFLDAYPDYTPEGWENRMVPPLPGAVQAALVEVAAAQAAGCVPRLLDALASLPNSVEVQTAGFCTLWRMLEKSNDLKHQARESAVYGLLLAAMRNYRSHVKLQTEASWSIFLLYLNAPFSETSFASGAALVERLLAAATAHGADAGCADAVCAALPYLLNHGEWACAAAEQGGAKAVLAISAAHAEDDGIQSNSMYVLARMVEFADWASVQAEAGGILVAAVRGLSVARVAVSDRRTNCIDTLEWLLDKDDSIAAQMIAASVFGMAIKAMFEDKKNGCLQQNGCMLLRRLASSSSNSTLPSAQLAPAQEVVLTVMGAHGYNKDVQHRGCLALQALQPLIRNHLCDVVEAARAKFPDVVGAQTTADTIGAIADALVRKEVVDGGPVEVDARPV